MKVLRDSPEGRLLSDGDLEGQNCLFPDRRFGEAVFLMDGGCVIEPCHMGLHAPRGMHGFHPDDPGANAVLLSSDEVAIETPDISALYDVMSAAVELVI